jgi:hypothetical protein
MGGYAPSPLPAIAPPQAPSAPRRHWVNLAEHGNGPMYGCLAARVSLIRHLVYPGSAISSGLGRYSAVNCNTARPGWKRIGLRIRRLPVHAPHYTQQTSNLPMETCEPPKDSGQSSNLDALHHQVGPAKQARFLTSPFFVRGSCGYNEPARRVLAITPTQGVDDVWFRVLKSF